MHLSSKLQHFAPRRMARFAQTQMLANRRKAGDLRVGSLFFGAEDVYPPLHKPSAALAKQF